ncbi:MAG TPA: DNA-binding domain-containing protein, partial [Tepidisphaeraceae bacterium]|nr:DNA-binding domain-containing protein [Tepidisphaeraceae bacterium]
MVKRSKPENISPRSTNGKRRAAAPKKPARSRSSDSRRPKSDLAALMDVQARFAKAVMAPLTDDWMMQKIAPSGQPMSEVVSDFVKPNDRLNSFERIEIYNRQYWFRLIDIMYEDYPGLAAILGQDRFNAFSRAYLTRYPSRSGLLRNLGRSIIKFISEEPELTAPYTDMAMAMARFQWGQVEAFDA